MNLLLAMSIDHYNTLLNSTADGNAKYFAQMQFAIAYRDSGAEWPEVEEKLLQASRHHPGRGEAMKVIVNHRRQQKEYGIAYMMSSISKQQYFGNVPDQKAWFVEPAYYQWKILNYHASICTKIDNHQEAAETFNELWEISKAHPEYFSPDQMQTIFQNQKAYQS